MLPMHKLRIIANIVAFGGPHVNEVIETGRGSACLGLVGAYACELTRTDALHHDVLLASWVPELCHCNRPNPLLNVDRPVALSSHIPITKPRSISGRTGFTLLGRGSRQQSRATATSKVLRSQDGIFDGVLTFTQMHVVAKYLELQARKRCFKD